MHYLLAAILVLLNTVWLGLELLGLPGNWLMVGTTVLLAWWRWDNSKPAGGQMFSPWTLCVIAALALSAEVLEFLTGAIGAKKAGATKRGAFGAVAGGFVGGLAGTAAIPLPVIGTLAGACIGACLGAWALELARGAPPHMALRAGIGGGLGRLAGRLIRLAIAGAIWLIAAVAAFWP
jgi:uncharacterized protein YqgC (DUF456 family)